jgi:cell wall-associated NlpC family hydrolase
VNHAFAALGIVAMSFAQAADAADAADRNDSGLRSDIVVRALTLIDTPYRYGGSSPAAGFDCSGLVRYVFQSVGAPPLPRRTEDIGKVGEPIMRSQLQPGDLVFFNTLSRAYSHVAIYIGDGRFLHAPARGGRVRIEALDDRYWRARFDGARRLIHADSRALQADVPGFFVARSSPTFPSDVATEVIKP